MTFWFVQNFSVADTRRTDFGFIPKLWDAWVVSGNASAIPQTRQFYQSLIAHGYTIVFLTGRNDYVANATISNLHDQGFNTYETLITRDPVEYHLTAYNYKSARRAQLAKMGYNIVGSIGDQLSDVNGDFAGYRMKVPNYCYFIA
jgi:predicted secreted acid phosphatase